MASSRESGRLLLLALALAAAPAGAATGTLRIPAEALVTGDPVHLGDIAQLEGDGAMALRGLVLSAAPRGTEVRVLDGARVLDALRLAGLDPAVTYTIPATIRLRRAIQEIPQPALRTLVEEWLARQLGPGAKDAALVALDTHGPVVVPTGAWTATVSVPPGVELRGRVRLEIGLAVDGVPVRTVWVTAEISRWSRVAVATRDIGRGEPVRPGDLALERREGAGLPRCVLTDLGEAEGAVAVRPLRAWSAVACDDLGAPVVVRRGTPVLLVAERGALRVSAAGEARHDAARGERVAVVARGSGKVIVGRVHDASTVTVGF